MTNFQILILIIAACAFAPLILKIGAKICNNCNSAIPANSDVCPECGKDPDFLPS